MVHFFGNSLDRGRRLDPGQLADRPPAGIEHRRTPTEKIPGAPRAVDQKPPFETQTAKTSLGFVDLSGRLRHGRVSGGSGPAALHRPGKCQRGAQPCPEGRRKRRFDGHFGAVERLRLVRGGGPRQNQQGRFLPETERFGAFFARFNPRKPQFDIPIPEVDLLRRERKRASLCDRARAVYQPGARQFEQLWIRFSAEIRAYLPGRAEQPAELSELPSK